MFELLVRNQFIEKKNCEIGVPSDYMETDSWARCFDNDGFELTKLEQMFYAAEGFPVRDRLNHMACQRDWMEQRAMHDGFILDHALVLERKGFSGYAAKQIQRHSKRNPQLLKYLKATPKWGIDFALEYYEKDEYIEVLHFEYDHTELEKAIESREMLGAKIMQTDWKDFVRQLLRHKEHWIGLQGMEQNDWKSRFWGIDKAEKTIKSFA